MEYTTKEKIDAIKGYINDMKTLARRIQNTDNIMNIMSSVEEIELFAGIYNTEKVLIGILKRLEGK